MTAMAEMTAEPHEPERWRKNSTRQAILAAARGLIAREGADSVTLGRVAVEAGFAAPAVYSYFVSKDELHLAIVADDLEMIALAMRGEGAETPEDGPPADIIAFQRPPRFSAPPQLETAVTDDAAEPVRLEATPEQPSDTPPGTLCLAAIQEAIGVVLDQQGDLPEEHAAPEPVPNAFPEDAQQLGSTEIALPKKAEQRWRRARAPIPDQQIALPMAEPSRPENASRADAAAIARLEEAVTRLENRPVDAWLERRLRVFERTLTDLESRMEKTERDSAGAVSSATDGYRGLEQNTTEAFSYMQRRMEEREQRQTAAQAEIKSFVSDLAVRLGALETRLARGLEAAGPAVEAPVPAAAEPEREAQLAGTPAASPADYLTAARRAANIAAAKAERVRAQGPMRVLATPPKRRVPRAVLQILAGVLILAALLTAAAMYLRVKTPPAPAILPTAQLSADSRVVALAKAGDPKAELFAGLKLLNGDGVTTDVPSAAYWLHRAALQSEPVAAYWLGTLYERGRGVAKDGAKAMRWYSEAAAAGNAKAMYRLGVAEAEGWNGNADEQAAARWFLAAAKFGVIDAQFNLAVLYERGTGVTKNLREAFTWYAIAAAQGDAESKVRIDALASQMTPQDVGAAQAAAARFVPAAPTAASNRLPHLTEVVAQR